MKAAALITLLAVPALRAAEKSPLLDALPQNAVQSAFQILRRDYIRREDLSFEELNRAALQGLLERLDFGAELVAVDGPEAPSKPSVFAEFLDPGVGYVRPGSFAEGEGAMFEKALAGLVEKKMEHLILDLRAARAGEFEESAQMLQCFVPRGELMFKLKQLNSTEAELFISKRAPLWEGRVLVLVDGEAGAAAEVVAACLRARGRAFMLGAKTRGAAVRYTEVKLDAKTALRYASAEMLLPDDTSVFKKGLEPDFPVTADMGEKRRAFEGSEGKSYLPFVRDRVRPRFNEHALVRGQNPELDDYVRRSLGQPLPGDLGQVRDVVTQRAMDLLDSREIAAQVKLDWKVKPEDLVAPPTEAIPKALPAVPAKP